MYINTVAQVRCSIAEHIKYHKLPNSFLYVLEVATNSKLIFTRSLKLIMRCPLKAFEFDFTQLSYYAIYFHPLVLSLSPYCQPPQVLPFETPDSSFSTFMTQSDREVKVSHMKWVGNEERPGSALPADMNDSGKGIVIVITAYYSNKKWRQYLQVHVDGQELS